MERLDESTDKTQFSHGRLRNLTRLTTTKTVVTWLVGTLAAICILTTLVLVSQFRDRCELRVADLTRQVNQHSKVLQVSQPGCTPSSTPGPASDLKIAFSVASKRDFVPLSRSVIPMEIETYNHGKYFDMATNRFTAPVSGVYAFFFGAGSNSGRNAQIFVRVSGNGSDVDVARAYDYSSPNHYGGASGSVIVGVNKGQHVSLWSVGHTGRTFAIHGNPNLAPSTLFSGYLLYKLD